MLKIFRRNPPSQERVCELSSLNQGCCTSNHSLTASRRLRQPRDVKSPNNGFRNSSPLLLSSPPTTLGTRPLMHTQARSTHVQARTNLPRRSESKYTSERFPSDKSSLPQVQKSLSIDVVICEGFRFAFIRRYARALRRDEEELWFCLYGSVVCMISSTRR